MNEIRQATELAQLNDKLNLSGRVFRVGEYAVKHGGCAYIWVGILVVETSSNLINGIGVDELELIGERVAVKVIREIGTSASIASLKRVRPKLTSNQCRKT